MDQKVTQHVSEIMMLNTKLETLRREYKQVVDIHSKCKSNKLIYYYLKTRRYLVTYAYNKIADSVMDPVNVFNSAVQKLGYSKDTPSICGFRNRFTTTQTNNSQPKIL